jgi:hypothetical protein
MKTSIVIIASMIAVLVSLYIKNKNECNKEGFTATGLVFNRPPEWFNKPKYNPDDWLVTYYPDQLSKPECLSYSRGNPQELNYLSSAYRFWRM